MGPGLLGAFEIIIYLENVQYGNDVIEERGAIHMKDPMKDKSCWMRSILISPVVDSLHR